MSSVCPSQHRIRALSLAVFMTFAVPLTVSAAQYSQTYDFNTEAFNDKWSSSVDLEAASVEFTDVVGHQDFQGVTQYVKSGPSIFLDSFVNNERMYLLLYLVFFLKSKKVNSMRDYEY